MTDDQPDPQPGDASTLSEPESYRAAAAELERILGSIEDERQVDIDELAEQAERASQLIRFCMDRLKKAEIRVAHVADELENENENENDEA